MLEQGLKDPSKRTVTTVYDSSCYICEDPEFALMGLPLCYPCVKCQGHVPADDSICSVCQHDQCEPPEPCEACKGEGKVPVPEAGRFGSATHIVCAICGGE